MGKGTSRARRPVDPIAQKLDAVLEVLRNIFIIEGKRAGLSQNQVRELLGVDIYRVSRVWRHIPRKEERR